ncbi:tautomerase family protein [Rhodoferax aquaticus]|nr:tautomerase family protein [Rhodoferax aquaticus]
MPTLLLKVSPLQNPAEYHALATELTQLTAEVLHKLRGVTVVIIEDIPAARWHIGGQVVDRPTAFLEISITAGTNTDAEKAAFVAKAYAAIQAVLAPWGSLAQASYVVVRELPAANWGFGGQTQAGRRAALAMA